MKKNILYFKVLLNNVLLVHFKLDFTLFFLFGIDLA